MLLPPPLSQKPKAGMVLDFAGWRRDRTQRPGVKPPLPGFACRDSHVLCNGQSAVSALLLYLKTKVEQVVCFYIFDSSGSSYLTTFISGDESRELITCSLS
jgi:hypothetical protein